MKMKKVLSGIVLTGLLVLPALGLAVGEVPTEVAPTVIKTGAGLVELITRVGNWIFALLMVIAGIFLVYAGFLWVTAGGNPENVTKARTMLINALIGVAIGLLARGLIMVVRSIIGTGA